MYAVLVTYRRPRGLAVMLDRLAEQRWPIETLIVVDNSPTDAARQLVHRHQAAGRRFVYAAASENLGPAGGIALGMRRILEAARGEDRILLLDDDDPPPPDAPNFLSTLVEFAGKMTETDPRTGAVGAGGFRFDWQRGRTFRVPDADLVAAVPVDVIGGSAFPLYRVDVVREIGVFDARLFFGWDDLEYGLRLRKAGYRLYAHGELWHDRRRRHRLGGRPSGARRNLAPWRQYYNVRNLVYILRSLGYQRAAVRATIAQGLVRPAQRLLVRGDDAPETLRLALRGSADGWAGRLGRTVEPRAGDVADRPKARHDHRGTPSTSRARTRPP